MYHTKQVSSLAFFVWLVLVQSEGVILPIAGGHTFGVVRKGTRKLAFDPLRTEERSDIVIFRIKKPASRPAFSNAATLFFSS